MLFNSIDFAVFLPLVFLLYWLIPNSNIKLQNLLIVVASYVFYGWWDWRFLTLIIFSSILDFSIGLFLLNEKREKTRKILLWTSILVNLGFLGFFKYFNFFIDNFNTVFKLFGNEISNNSLNIILPVGISFYTFQTLSYTIDVYNNKLKPSKDFIAFAAFVSFFPQLVAGPIERAVNLLPQFHQKRFFNYQNATDGLRQILWGLFKKIVIADNCAEYANIIFNNSDQYSGFSYFLGALFFTFQIYGDFSGYSDIAIGTSRLFGFNLMRNFAFPYFSRDIAEFWRRWHISLSTWFRDYLYIPLGGSKGNKSSKIRNTFIIFIVSGFWHGASWNFVIWGLINAIYFLPLLLRDNNRNHLDIVAEGKFFPDFKDFTKMLFTFFITVIAWIFFRANSTQQAFNFIKSIFSNIFNSDSYLKALEFIENISGFELPILIFIFLLIEWIGRENQHALEKLGLKWNKPLRWIFYQIVIFAIFWYGGKEQEFIYFQF
jgi:alginate O-acetyltransferase complex protein AlgI